MGADWAGFGGDIGGFGGHMRGFGVVAFGREYWDGWWHMGLRGRLVFCVMSL